MLNIYIYIFFFSKNRAVFENVENYGGVRQATRDNIMRRRKDAICMLDN
jgi:hypothetical protein